MKKAMCNRCFRWTATTTQQPCPDCKVALAVAARKAAKA